MQEKITEIKWVFLLLIWFFPLNAWSSDSPGENFLQNVSSELSEGGLTVRFEFSQPVLSSGKPIFDKNSVRVDLPRIFSQPAKRFYYTGDSRIPQILASQIQPGFLQLQFVLGEKLPRLHETFQVEEEGRALVFHIFKKEEDVLSEFLARASDRLDSVNDQEIDDREEQIPAEPEPNTVTGLPGLLEENNEGFILDKVASESPSSVEFLKQKNSTVPSLSNEENSEPESGGPLDPVALTVKTFSMFALVLALMFLVFYLFKKFVLKNTIFGGGEKFVRVLGTGFLGPKKNIVLVEVVGEVLVLGISNDNISLLTHIQDEEKIEKIKDSGKDSSARKFLNPQQENDLSPKSSGLGGAFTNYLKQFSGPPSVKEKSVEEVTELIRKNLGKLKTL